VTLAKQTVGFAQQNLEAERARFSVGRSTNNDVLLRQQELKNAEISVVRATVDLLDSEIALSAITAEILDRYGVVLKGL
jgi:outer membrane protein